MLNGKTALITGSTTGIGYAVAEKLAAEGCNVVLNGVEKTDAVAEKVQALEETFGIHAVYDGTDVGRAEAVEAMVENATAHFGSIDILVNNAVTRVFGPIDQCTAADWDRAIAVNLSSAFHTIRGVLPGMRARNWGRIINMSSIYGLIGAADRASYVVSKTGLIGLARAVALETMEYEITCNAVCPGSVDTPRSDQAVEAAMQAEGISKQEAVDRFLAGKQPAGRLVSAESVAAMVTFLCGPTGRDINGAVLPIDLAWSAS